MAMEETPEQRKARLAAMRKQAEEAGALPAANAPAEGEDGDGERVVKFRNYVPHNQKLERERVSHWA